MKKQIIILFVLLSTALLANAQSEYRVAKSTGELKLYFSSNMIIEGYDGKEIIFSGQGVETGEVDERAKGLVPLSSSGYRDNTGLGISVVENGQNITARFVAKQAIGTLTIKVPQNVKVSLFNSDNSLFINNRTQNAELTIKNLKSEIEVSSYAYKIKLENNTGPMNIKNVRGGIDAIFNSDIKGPVSIISVYDYVDITLPSSTKANIELGTNYGKVYAGKEFNIDIDKNEVEEKQITIKGIKPLSGKVYVGKAVDIDKNDIDKKQITIKGEALQTMTTKLSGSLLKQQDGQAIGTDSSKITFNSEPFTFSTIVSLAGEKIKGKLNGGGIDLIFKSTNKNVYLRQK